MAETVATVPHLVTANSGPLHAIESHILEHQARIENWFRRAWLDTPAPFYASVDLRNAGFKLAPVDTNLFPAGFNNLSPDLLPLSIQAVQVAVERVCPTARGVMIIPENHTRNTFYLESVATLCDILRTAGLTVRIGSLIEGLEAPWSHDLPSGRSLTFYPLERRGNTVWAGDFSPCMVLLNNDLSGGRPPQLEDLDQIVVPPLSLGWSQRLKSGHAAHYQEVAESFAELIDLDPWLIEPLYRNCGEIDFKKREGEECVIESTARLLDDVRAKYRAYGIDNAAFAVVKADAGTYGMGVLTVRDADELRQLNRKQRNRMASSKDGQTVSRVLIQEGVYTFETWGPSEIVAEPVVYMIDHHVVGGFYRVHHAKGMDENLNSPGMDFHPLAFADSCITPRRNESPDAEPNRFYAYGVIARLAVLAAAREISAALHEATVGAGAAEKGA